MSTNIIKRLLSARTGNLASSVRTISIYSVPLFVPEHNLQIPWYELLRTGNCISSEVWYTKRRIQLFGKRISKAMFAGFVAAPYHSALISKIENTEYPMERRNENHTTIPNPEDSSLLGNTSFKRPSYKVAPGDKIMKRIIPINRHPLVKNGRNVLPYVPVMNIRSLRITASMRSSMRTSLNMTTAMEDRRAIMTKNPR